MQHPVSTHTMSGVGTAASPPLKNVQQATSLLQDHKNMQYKGQPLAHCSLHNNKHLRHSMQHAQYVVQYPTNQPTNQPTNKISNQQARQASNQPNGPPIN